MSVPRFATKSTCKIREIDKPGLPVINEEATDTPVLLRGPNVPPQGVTPPARKPQSPPTKRNLCVLYSEHHGCTIAKEVGVMSDIPIRIALILPCELCDHMVAMSKQYAKYQHRLPPLENYIVPYDLCHSAFIIPAVGGKFDIPAICQLGKVLTLLCKARRLVVSGKIQNSVLEQAVYGYYTVVLRILTNVCGPCDCSFDSDLGPDPDPYLVLRNHIYRYCAAAREDVAHPKETVSYSTYLERSTDPLVFKMLNAMADAAIEEIMTAGVL